MAAMGWLYVDAEGYPLLLADELLVPPALAETGSLAGNRPFQKPEVGPG
jgi:hypothetical protein